MTVSYTCQKPIKFWAKCKINLLYKLNQSLLCVPGCPLLLATRLRAWAPFLLPLILHPLSCVFIRPLPPQPSLLPYWPPFGLLSPQPLYRFIPRFLEPASQIRRKPALSVPHVSAVLLCLVPVGSLWRASTLFLSIFLNLAWLASDKCLSDPSVSVC